MPARTDCWMILKSPRFGRSSNRFIGSSIPVPVVFSRRFVRRRQSTTKSRRSSRRYSRKPNGNLKPNGVTRPNYAQFVGHPAAHSLRQKYTAAYESNENRIRGETSSRAGAGFQRKTIRRAVKESSRQLDRASGKHLSPVAGCAA